jgi:cobalt-zinc-cadmium efflux system membrane fusion protein
MMGRHALALVIGLTTVTSAGCGGASEETREADAMKAAAPSRVQADGTIRLSDQDRSALGLVVEPASEADLPNGVLRFGRIINPVANEARVVSPVTGRITRPPRIQLGAQVTSGAELLEIQPELDVPERISVGTEAAQRQGDIAVAQRELARAEADAERARALSPQVVSAAQLQQAETAVATARARLEGLQGARTAETTARAQAVAVSAPIAGTVAELTATVGSLVNRGDLLARIVKPGPLWVDVSVPPDQPVGNRYEIVMGPTAISATLLTRGRLADSGGTRTDRLIIAAADASGLVPGSTVSIRVGHGVTRGIVIPESAIVPGVETDTVFVETATGTFASRSVQVAARYGGRVRLARGLNIGDRVVVRGGMALQGELVRSQLRPAG